MSQIRALESLSGFISTEATLSGKLSADGGLKGKLSIVKEYNSYSGDYSVVPRAFNAQTLETADKLLSKDIIVTEVPYFETSNTSKGVTVYIAKET